MGIPIAWCPTQGSIVGKPYPHNPLETLLFRLKTLLLKLLEPQKPSKKPLKTL